MLFVVAKEKKKDIRFRNGGRAEHIVVYSYSRLVCSQKKKKITLSRNIEWHEKILIM